MWISLSFAALAALLNLWLAMRCGRVRMANKILHGDGGNVLMGRRMRAHANFAEFTPIVLILFVLVEMTLGSCWPLAAVAAVYLVGRVLHAIGMDADGDAKPRMFGILITFLTTIALALAALYAAWQMYGAASGVDFP